VWFRGSFVTPPKTTIHEITRTVTKRSNVQIRRQIRALTHSLISRAVITFKVSMPFKIARDWNAKYNEPKCGYVTRFRVRKSFLDRYQPKTVGSAIHQEYWIPAGELEEFNQNILGPIEVIAEF
jgi:hypothetical protein